MSQPLDNDIKFLTGVGEARANLLRTELGIRTVGDLLRHYPYRYIDRTRFYRIGEIRDDSLSYIQAPGAHHRLPARGRRRKNVSSPP